MEIAHTKDEGPDTQLTEGAGCSEVYREYEAHGGRREMMLQRDIHVRVKRGTEFHRKLEARLCLGLVCRRISPACSGVSNRETHQEPATTENMGLA